MLTDFFALFYPKLCAGCGNTLTRIEKAVCMNCQLDFAPIPIKSVSDNLIAKQFWGRVDLKYAVSRIAFGKDHKIQNVLHNLKYEGNKYAGLELGEMLGNMLKNYSIKPDRIIPVPLHPRRLKERGYNQSELIAQGVAEVIDTIIDTDSLIRTDHSATQTKKSRIDRWDNVEYIFKLQHPDNLIGQEVLIIDDVLTTGATLEACVRVVKKGPVDSIGIATVACVV